MARLAQSVERTFNLVVVGSSPTVGVLFVTAAIPSTICSGGNPQNEFLFGATRCKLHVNACHECVATRSFLDFDSVWNTTDENNRCHMHSGASCTLDY
jgi:hypothetical protein